MAKHLRSKFSVAEKKTIFGLIAVIVIALGGQLIFYNQRTTVQPVSGGVFIEGVLGEPQIINPLYSRPNTVEGDLAKLIFSGLVKLGPGRDILPDLAESWEIQNNGKTYLFHLRGDLKFQDGENLDANDVVFTMQVLHDPAYSGQLKSDWQSIVAGVVDDQTVRFDLPEPSTFFLAKATVGILPEHLFAHLPVADIGEPKYNRQPVGSGPYKFVPASAGQENITLEPSPYYYDGEALIGKIVFTSFDNESSMYSALANGNITAAGFYTTVET
ncbi:MAG: ABC transporter substrate-binding protein, partial [Patescibacteria group bacterium]